MLLKAGWTALMYAKSEMRKEIIATLKKPERNNKKIVLQK
jgi:hypothetical protein